MDHVFDHIHEQCDGMHKRLVNTIGVALSIKGCTTRSMDNVETDPYGDVVSLWKMNMSDHKHWRLVNTIGVALPLM